ncbi:MAG: hypothetical protein QM786_08960 [Breznakibacter sp.]
MQGTKLTPMGGVNLFYGDLVDKSRSSYSFGAAFERDINRYFAGRANLMMGQMKGTQLLPQSDLQYAYFENKYFEFGVGANFRILDYALGYFKQRTFSPYVTGQFGIIYYDATEWYGNGAGDYPDGSPKENTVWHDAKGISPLVTLGGGISFWITPRISFRTEFLANKPFTDMLDAHKEWDDNEGVIHPTDAGDFYYTATAGITITLKDNRWRNEPKYNRKTYVKMRKYNMSSGSNRSKFKVNRR